MLNAAWLPIISIYLPETKGLTLEEVDEVFSTDDFHLRHNATGAGGAVVPTLGRNDVENGGGSGGKDDGKDDHVVVQTTTKEDSVA